MSRDKNFQNFGDFGHVPYQPLPGSSVSDRHFEKRASRVILGTRLTLYRLWERVKTNSLEPSASQLPSTPQSIEAFACFTTNSLDMQVPSEIRLN